MAISIVTSLLFSKLTSLLSSSIIELVIRKSFPFFFLNSSSLSSQIVNTHRGVYCVGVVGEPRFGKKGLLDPSDTAASQKLNSAEGRRRLWSCERSGAAIIAYQQAKRIFINSFSPFYIKKNLGTIFVPWLEEHVKPSVSVAIR